MKDIYELIKKYRAVLAAQVEASDFEATIFIRTAEGVFSSDKGPKAREAGEKLFAVLGKDIKAAVFAASPWCLRYASCGKKELKASLEDMAQIIGPEAFAVDPEKDGAAGVKAALAESGGCFIRGAGALTVGRNPYEAAVALSVLEKAAEAATLSESLGGGKPLPAETAALLRKKYLKSYSVEETKVREAELLGRTEKDAPCAEAASAAPQTGDAPGRAAPPVMSDPGTAAAAPRGPAACEACGAEESRLRQALTDCGRELLKRGLVQGTWGNLSVRLDDRFMLVTPTGVDYLRLTPQDMVKVPIDAAREAAAAGDAAMAAASAQAGRKPTSEKDLHGAVYGKRKDAGAVIHTHSRYVSVFASAERAMPVLGEYKDVLGERVELAKYGLPGSRELAENAAKAMGEGPCVLMPHHGLAVCGSDLKQALMICAAAEENAKKIFVDKAPSE